jgi:hypothetical protein
MNTRMIGKFGIEESVSTLNIGEIGDPSPLGERDRVRGIFNAVASFHQINWRLNCHGTGTG